MRYGVISYGRMIEPGPRLEAYTMAMKNRIGRKTIVADIGTGTGYFAVLAARLGAERVYAIEPDEAIQVARELARENGVEDRIEFLQARSTEVTLERRADVIVSDMRGTLPLYGSHIPSIIDARERLLAPGGHLIPASDTIRVAVAHAPDAYRKYIEPWTAGSNGMAMDAQRRRAVNSWFTERIEPSSLRTEPLSWVTLDYASVGSPDVRGELEWEVERDGTAHGLSVWFDAEIGPGATFTTGPDGPKLVYGTAFFPFERPLDLEAGDRLHVEMKAVLVDEDYTWVWNSRLLSADGTERVAFRQSTMLGAPVGRDRLRRRASDYRPRLGEEGRVDVFVLDRMDGERPISAIADELEERWPELFTEPTAALSRVSDLSVRYSSDQPRVAREDEP